MTKLIRTANFADCDSAYDLLIEAHEGLDEAQSVALNARLILILANHVGDEEILSQAISLARESLGSSAP